MWTHDRRGAVLGGVAIAELFREGAVGGAIDGGASGGAIKTPAYVYDLDAMAEAARDLARGFGRAPHLIAYAVKANSAGPVVRALARAGCGAEVVSGGELLVAIGCGVSADDILYSGVGKLDRELDQAIGAGERGIYALQMESIEEIARIEARAVAVGRRARVSIRCNPSVETDTHAGVATGHDEAKFGIGRRALPAAWEALERAPHLDLVGLSTHIGSQLTQTGEYLAAAEILLGVAAARQAVRPSLEFIDFGGGFGIDYGAGCPARPADFARGAVRLLEGSALRGLKVVVEPGRSLVAAHGVLCAKVISSKRSATDTGELRWLIIDAGMNDLMRPATYQALHRIEPLDRAPSVTASETAKRYRVVGPVCESSDDFGAHPFEEVPAFVVIRDAGAYGFTMASEYNGRGLAAEVFLSGGRVVGRSEGGSVEEWVRRRVGSGAMGDPGRS